MGKRPLRHDQIMYYATQTLNVAYTAYREGELELTAHLLGMCEECVEGFFADLGVTNKSEDWEFDIDDYNRVFAYEEEDEEEEEDDFDHSFWSAQMSDFDA